MLNGAVIDQEVGSARIRGRDAKRDCSSLGERATLAPRRKNDRSPGHKSVRTFAPEVAGSRALPTAQVNAEELQTALFFVLALYASVGLINLTSEWSTLLQAWPGFMEFLVYGVLAR
jgi:hypothetical protein